MSAPGAPSQRPNPAIYGHFERLVPISIEGRIFEVPEGIKLIRALQFVQFELGAMRTDWSRFCFNDTSGCCETTLETASGASRVRACRVRVRRGLVVERLPDGSGLIEGAGRDAPPGAFR